MSIKITDYGAKTNGSVVTDAIQYCIDLAAHRGGDCVVVPTGTFVTGAIELKSNVELYLSSGAVLKFSDNPQDYSSVISRWEGVARSVYQPCVYAKEAHNITIKGTGLIDGSGQNWWKAFRENQLVYPRPKLIGLDNCQRIVLKDFNMIDSPSWTISPAESENITIDNVSIKNPYDSPNTDGIDPDSCQNVRITNCQIDVGDDCIAVKAGTERNNIKVPCENILITNCTLLHGHGAIVIGSEMSGGVSNVVVSNCIFEDTDRGIRLKTRRGRGGMIENLIVDNIIMNGVVCPFVMNQFYFCGPDGKTDYVASKKAQVLADSTPRFSHLRFSNIIANNVKAAAGFIYGLPEQKISDVTFMNIQIELSSSSLNSRAEYPAMMSGIDPMRQQGFIIRNATNVVCNHVQINNNLGEPFVIEDCDEVHVLP